MFVIIFLIHNKSLIIYLYTAVFTKEDCMHACYGGSL